MCGACDVVCVERVMLCVEHVMLCVEHVMLCVERVRWRGTCDVVCGACEVAWSV